MFMFSLCFVDAVGDFFHAGVEYPCQLAGGLVISVVVISSRYGSLGVPGATRQSPGVGIACSKLRTDWIVNLYHIIVAWGKWGVLKMTGDQSTETPPLTPSFYYLLVSYFLCHPLASNQEEGVYLVVYYIY